MSEPDWENFAKAVLTDWPTGDLDGAVLFDLSLQYGMIQEVPGGYNSDHHIDAEGICPEDGDPWYEYTFRGEAGPGLYSINDMADRIEELEAEVARLRLLVPRPDQTQDELVWRDHMRGVPLAALAKEFGCTKERMRYRLKKIAENKLHLTGGNDG